LNWYCIIHLKKICMESTTQNPGTFRKNEHSKLLEFFVDQLKDIYWAEKKLVKTLPKLSEAATSEQLRKAFQDHLVETKTHVSRLEDVFSMVGVPPDAVKCPAMAGIVDEGEDIISQTDSGTAQRDVGLIFAGQKAEHYEIATYGGMIQLANTMGYGEVAELLKQTLGEEKKADELLSDIAENSVNQMAFAEMG
jgi:ferritin-like metal-binding protein YciE